ncbi:MAG: hypothetical protein M1834_003870 [Cirrosporium novae-zelandiae]|nr:MAG: hypothetical protein M1834_003870 [Cirrosporium novae-zelandiae]
MAEQEKPEGQVETKEAPPASQPPSKSNPKLSRKRTKTGCLSEPFGNLYVYWEEYTNRRKLAEKDASSAARKGPFAITASSQSGFARVIPKESSLGIQQLHFFRLPPHLNNFRMDEDRFLVKEFFSRIYLNPVASKPLHLDQTRPFNSHFPTDNICHKEDPAQHILENQGMFQAPQTPQQAIPTAASSMMNLWQNEMPYTPQGLPQGLNLMPGSMIYTLDSVAPPLVQQNTVAPANQYPPGPVPVQEPFTQSSFQQSAFGQPVMSQPQVVHPQEAIPESQGKLQSATACSAVVPSHHGTYGLPASNLQYHRERHGEEEPDSDEDMPSDSNSLSQQNLGIMVALAATHHTQIVRTFTDVLNEPNVLVSYRPADKISLVDDPEAARIFCHFIKATGPSLSIFERHPINPERMFSGEQVPKSHQALWTYTIPNMALQNQALMHAILALACLHICKLQGTPIDSSFKHYGFALVRIRKSLSNSTKRRDLATFAATLLLGYFEVMTAEHQKWNNHLSGAKQLVMETDYLGMTKQIRLMRAEAASRRKYETYGDFNIHGMLVPIRSWNPLDDVLLDGKWDVDENLLGEIMGQQVQYDNYGTVLDETGQEHIPRATRLTQKDVETYEYQSDLYWWYLKQDAFQSVISGNRLLLPYNQWAACPPRGPIGRHDAIYGTADHLVLLLGRVGDFAAKDVKRKLKGMEMNGGMWRPVPGMFPSGPGPPGQSGPSFQGRGGPPPGIPQTAIPRMPSGPMFGMVPPSGPRRMPTAYTRNATVSPSSGNSPNSTTSELDFDVATHDAISQYNSIASALDLFEASLGPDYAPLPSDVSVPYATPFGPSITYRTFSIGVIWALYYAARIILTRVHPHMPPAAMIAQSVAASQTARYALLIGRINAGLHPRRKATFLNPLVGSALMEGTLALFFAGVQFQDPGQRVWVVSKLRDLTTLSGWQTSLAIASGCESAWVNAYQAGRGPPYERTIKREGIDGQEGRGGVKVPEELSQRRVIDVSGMGRKVHWAMGLLSTEEELAEKVEGLRF